MPEEPPAMALLALPDSMALISGDEVASEARNWLHATVLDLWMYAGDARAVYYLSTVQPWEKLDSECFQSLFSYGGEPETWGIYRCCWAEGEWEWQFRIRRECGGEPGCLNYPASRGRTSMDGSVGEFQSFVRHDSVHVTKAWSFQATVNRASGTWSFYQGEASPGSLVGTMDFVVDEDGSETWDWTWPRATIRQGRRSIRANGRETGDLRSSAVR